MIEKVFKYSTSDEKAVEEIIMDENLHDEVLELIIVKAPAPKNYGE